MNLCEFSNIPKILHMTFVFQIFKMLVVSTFDHFYSNLISYLNFFNIVD